MRILFIFFVLLMFGCSEAPQGGDSPAKGANNPPASPRATPVAHIEQSPAPKALSYSWKGEQYDEKMALVNQIPLPKGYERVEVKAGSFAEWLRFLPLQAAGSPVMLHNGQQKPYQAGAYRVVDIDIGKANLQQCADAVMRLKAEYHYSQQDYTSIHFNYTSGDKVAFVDWAKGRKPRVQGNKVSFSAAGGSPDYSYANFKKYLQNIFMFAGTASLEREMQRIALEELTIGDVFIQGGYPGHAVLIVDMAVNPETQHKIFLLAQSYMPAQSIHVLKNFKHQSGLSPWYPIDFGTTLYTPEWDFEKGRSRRF